MADVLAAPIVRARSADATNLGAGVLAAWAAGWFPSLPDAAAAMTATTASFVPDDEGAVTYDRLYREIYVHLFPALRTYVDRLTELSASPSA
jgi:xylulokinase